MKISAGMPACSLRRSTDRCGVVPKLGEPKLNLPGLVFASAMNSFTFFTGSDGVTTVSASGLLLGRRHVLVHSSLLVPFAGRGRERIAVLLEAVDADGATPHPHPHGREPTVLELRDKAGQQALEIRRLADDELDHEVERVGALGLGEQLLAPALFALEHRDLKHHVAAQLGRFQLKAGVFDDHATTSAAR